MRGRSLRHLFCILLVIKFLVIPQSVKATHGIALEFHYFWVSDSTYNFTCVYFRNCKGFTAVPPANIQVTASSVQLGDSFTFLLPMLPYLGSNVPPLVPPMLLGCNSLFQCVEEYVYRTNVTMPRKARDWRFLFEYCCNPPEADNILPNVMFTIAGLNNLDFPDSLAKNIAPLWHTRRPNIPGHLTDTLVNYPIKVVCEYRNYTFDLSAKEYQTDRVKYEILQPLGGYRSPYSTLKPLPHDSPPAFDIDSSSGLMHYNPVRPDTTYGNEQMYFIRLKATEFRSDTDLIGGNYVSREKAIGFVERFLLLMPTDSGDCPDEGHPFTDTIYKTYPMKQITLNCTSSRFRVTLKIPVLCSSIDSNASHIIMIDTWSLDTVNTISAHSVHGNGFKTTDEFWIEFDQPLHTGNYLLMFKKGDDGNTMITQCMHEYLPYKDTLNIKVLNPVYPGEIIGDSISGSRDTLFMECNASVFDLFTTAPVKCNSVHAGGSDFLCLNENATPATKIPVKSAFHQSCINGNTKQIRVTLDTALPTGNYNVYLVRGKDGNSVLDHCRSWDTSMLPLSVREVPLDLGKDFYYCKNSGFDTVISAGNIFASYTWSTGHLGHFILVDKAGTYWVKVKSPDGCEKSDTIHIYEEDCYIGIGENDIEDLEVFPIPASSFVILRISPQLINSGYTIYDLNGQLIKSGICKEEGEIISLEGFNPGFYRLHIVDSQLRAVNKPLIVQ